MARHVFALLVIMIAGTATSFAQECLHGSGESVAQQTRREQALTVARQINVAQATTVGPRTGDPRYRSLGELRNVSKVPEGFDLQLFTDGRGYSFSLKDKLDPCHYAIFSDQDKRVYEALPRTQGGLIPARHAPENE